MDIQPATGIPAPRLADIQEAPIEPDSRGSSLSRIAAAASRDKLSSDKVASGDRHAPELPDMQVSADRAALEVDTRGSVSVDIAASDTDEKVSVDTRVSDTDEKVSVDTRVSDMDEKASVDT